MEDRDDRGIRITLLRFEPRRRWGRSCEGCPDMVGADEDENRRWEMGYGIWKKGMTEGLGLPYSAPSLADSGGASKGAPIWSGQMKKIEDGILDMEYGRWDIE